MHVLNSLMFVHDFTFTFHFHAGEGNGNPLQCSSLENPRDGGAWWAAVYGVAQNWTQLKWLSSSSSTIKNNLLFQVSNNPAHFMFNTSSVQSLSPVWLFVTPWIAAHQASLSITNSQSLLKFTSIQLVMPSSHLSLCGPLLLLPSIFPSIRVFSKESVLCIRWQKYWSFSFSISPSNEYSRLISFMIDWLDLLAVQGTLNILKVIVP